MGPKLDQPSDAKSKPLDAGAPYLNEQTNTDNDLYVSQSYVKLDCPPFPVVHCPDLSSSATKFTPSILRSFVHSLTHKTKTCHIWHHGMLAIISFAGGRKEEIGFCWENVPQSDPQHLIEAPSSISRNRRETWTRAVLPVAYGRDVCQPRYIYASGYSIAVFGVFTVESIPHFKMGTIRPGPDPFSSSHTGEMHISQDIIMHRDTAWY